MSNCRQTSTGRQTATNRQASAGRTNQRDFLGAYRFVDSYMTNSGSTLINEANSSTRIVAKLSPQIGSGRFVNNYNITSSHWFYGPNSNGGLFLRYRDKDTNVKLLNSSNGITDSYHEEYAEYGLSINVQGDDVTVMFLINGEVVETFTDPDGFDSNFNQTRLDFMFAVDKVDVAAIEYFSETLYEEDFKKLYRVGKASEAGYSPDEAIYFTEQSGTSVQGKADQYTLAGSGAGDGWGVSYPSTKTRPIISAPDEAEIWVPTATQNGLTSPQIGKATNQVKFTSVGTTPAQISPDGWTFTNGEVAFIEDCDELDFSFNEPFSFEFAVKDMVDTGNAETIMQKITNNGVLVGSATNYGFDILQRNDLAGNALYFRFRDNSGNIDTINTTADLTGSELKHVVMNMLWDRGEIYVNGVLSFAAGLSGFTDDLINNGDLMIGSSTLGAGSFNFGGKFYRPIIRRRKLDKFEVRRAYENFLRRNC